MFGRRRRDTRSRPLSLPAPTDAPSPSAPIQSAQRVYASYRLMSYAGMVLIGGGVVLAALGESHGPEQCTTQTTTVVVNGHEESRKVQKTCEDPEVYEGPAAIAALSGAFLLLPQLLNALPGGTKVKASTKGFEAEIGPDQPARELQQRVPDDAERYQRRRVGR